MALVCAGMFMMMGFVGVSASLWFNKKIFASLVKTDTVEIDTVEMPSRDDSNYSPPTLEQVQDPNIDVQ